MNNGIHKIDYSLTGVESKNAKKKVLADAQWYLPPVSKKEMKKLLERRDLPAILDTLLWFGLIVFSGFCIYFLWGFRFSNSTVTGNKYQFLILCCEGEDIFRG